jgi:hypothetical protein
MKSTKHTHKHTHIRHSSFSLLYPEVLYTFSFLRKKKCNNFSFSDRQETCECREVFRHINNRRLDCAGTIYRSFWWLMEGVQALQRLLFSTTSTSKDCYQPHTSILEGCYQHHIGSSEGWYQHRHQHHRRNLRFRIAWNCKKTRKY